MVRYTDNFTSIVFMRVLCWRQMLQSSAVELWMYLSIGGPLRTFACAWGVLIWCPGSLNIKREYTVFSSGCEGQILNVGLQHINCLMPINTSVTHRSSRWLQHAPIRNDKHSVRNIKSNGLMPKSCTRFRSAAMAARFRLGNSLFQNTGQHFLSLQSHRLDRILVNRKKPLWHSGRNDY